MKNIYIKSVWLLILSSMMIIAPISAFEVPTHEDLSRTAFDRSVVGGSYLREQLQFSPTQRFDGLLPRDWIVRGSNLEDENFSNLFVRFRYINHFYDPVNNRGLRHGLISGEAAPQWALEQPNEFSGQDYSWRDARRYFLTGLTAPTPRERETNLAKTFRSIGQVVHLIQDMGSPEHTRNDIHGGWPLFGLGEASLFEGHTDVLRGRGSLNFGDYQNPSFGVLEHFWRSGSGSGFAEYTNRNFISKATNFTAAVNGNTGGGYPSPQLNLALQETVDIRDVIPTAPITGKMTFFKNNMADFALGGISEENNRMTTYSIFDQDLRDRGKPERFSVNTATVEKAAGFLVPRAVGYSTGLIDHFFRGKLDLALSPDQNDNTIVRLEGKNDSSEKLDGGTLELYADDSNGVRTAVTPVGSTIVSAEPGQQISVPFRLPNNADKFMAVYKGKLGDETPSGNFPGAVIGKVVEAVQVEQLFRDNFRWYIRNADGAYPTEISIQDVEELQWGDKENTLVGRSGYRPGQPSLFYAFEINRTLTATNVPLKAPGLPLPDQPETLQVVDLNLTQQVAFPYGINIGTNIAFSQAIHFKQYLSSQSRTINYVYSDGTYQGVSSQVSNYKFDLVGEDRQQLNRTYPVVIVPNTFDQGDPAHPYNAYIPEISLTKDGHILAMIEIALTDPGEQVSFPRKDWTWQQGFWIRPEDNLPTLRDTVPVTVHYEFPHRGKLTELIWVLIDVTQQQVLASTAPPTINVNSDKEVTLSGQTDIPFAGSVELVYENYTGGGPFDGLFTGNLGHVPYMFFSQPPRFGECPLSDFNSLQIVGELNFQHGPSSMSANYLRPELGSIAAASTNLVTEEFKIALACSNPDTGSGPIGLRFTGTHIDGRFSRPYQVMRTVPGTAPEQLVINAFHFPDSNSSGWYRHVKWTPGNNTAEVIKEYFGDDDYYILSATPSDLLVQSYISANDYNNGPKILEPLNTHDPTLTMTGVDWNDFYLLDPDYLYDADALKFYSKQSTPQVTSLPKSLATASSGNPRGRYHLLRLRGLVN